MKFASILVSVLAFSAMAHADEFSNFENVGTMSNRSTPIDEMTLVSSNTQQATAGMQTTKVETPTFGKNTSTWNFNLGMSEFEKNYGALSGFKGKGLTFEIQKRFKDIFYIGANYSNYTTEGIESYYSDRSLNRTTKSSLGIAAVSLEGHMIRLPLPGRSEFYAAVSGGLLSAMSFGNEDWAFVNRPGFFYGAGVGINISNQIGLRADMKSTSDIRSYNSISLVGYY